MEQFFYCTVHHTHCTVLYVLWSCCIYSTKIIKGTDRPDWICMRMVHWIGLEEDINRDIFLIILFHFWMFEKTSESWAASYKNESSLLFFQITFCVESSLPIGWRQRIKSAKVLLTRRNPKNNCWLSYICGARFDPIQTAIRTSRRLEEFLCEAAQNFEVFSNIQNKNLTIKNLWRLMTFLRPIQWHNSHADPIWPDGTFMCEA
jgi:hypothetical protein